MERDVSSSDRGRARGQKVERRRLRDKRIEQIRHEAEQAGRPVPPLEAFRPRYQNNLTYAKWQPMERCAAAGTAEVCPEWADLLYGFENFVGDMGQRPSPNHGLKRVDTGRPWGPGNAEWVWRLSRRGAGDKLHPAEDPKKLEPYRKEYREMLARERHLDPAQLTRKDRTPNYMRWKLMNGRCNNEFHPDYRYYGEARIGVYREWNDDDTIVAFENYAAYILSELNPPPSPQHDTIDRINVYQDYEPGNIQWATRAEQQENKRSVKGPPPPDWVGGHRYVEALADHEAAMRGYAAAGLEIDAERAATGGRPEATK